jgi:hypothetical protein
MFSTRTYHLIIKFKCNSRHSIHYSVSYTGCSRVVKKLHNWFVIKNMNFYFFLDDSYAYTAH